MSSAATKILPSLATSIIPAVRHELTTAIQSPVVATIGLAQPLLYLLLFGPVLTGLSELGGGSTTGAYRIFVPALFVQLTLFGGAFVGISLVTEFRAGVLERIFATPVPRSAFLAGKVIRDCIVLLIETLLVSGVAFLLGFRTTLLGFISCLGLVVLMSVTMSSLSYLLALTTKSEDALAGIFNVILLPILLLAGIMLPMSLAPTWLRAVSSLNPVTYVVEGARSAIAQTYGDGHLLWGYLSAVLMAAAAYGIAAHRFCRQD